MGVRVACLLCVLSLLGVLSLSHAQVGLRAAPLINNPGMHGAGVRDSVGRGVFSSWPQEDNRPLRNHRNHSSNIEHSLAAIFRGVAYGISTPPTTPTTTTTTTTTSTTPPPSTSPSSTKGHTKTPAPRPSVWPDLEDLLMGLDNSPMGAFPDIYADLELDGGAKVEEAEAESWAGSLGVAWAVHVYCSASMFTVVGLLAVLLLSGVRGAGRFLPLGHHLALHLLMLTAAVSRCLHLFHDPYGTEDKLPEALAGVVEDVGWPCLTAAIAVVVMALVQAWRCPPHPPPNHAPITLAIITVFHFLVAVSTQVLAVQFPKHAGPLRAASRTATAAWGGVVGFGSCVGTCRVVQALQNAPTLMTVTVGRPAPEWLMQHSCASLLYAARLTLVATLVQVMLAGLHLYGLLGSLVTTRLPPPRPWHWLGFQSASSGLEVLAWVMLALISLPSLRGSHQKRRSETSVWRNLRERTCLWCCCCHHCSRTSGGGRSAHQGSNHCQVVQTREERPYPSTAPSCTASPYKQALLRSTASEAHLLWSHARARDAPTSSCSSRPSSIVVNNEDLPRLNETVERYPVPSAPPHGALQSYKAPGTAQEKASLKPAAEEPTAYDQHLYYNVPVVAPDISATKPSPRMRRSTERPSERLLQGQLNVDLHGGDSDEDPPRSELASLTDYSSTEPASPGAAGDNDWSRNTTTTCSSVSAANSFDLRMFEDSDGTYYQLPYTQTPPPPPPPPLNLRHHYHHYPSRSLAASVAELQEGRKIRPAQDPRSEAQRSHPDLMTHTGSSPYKLSSVQQWSPKGLQRGFSVSAGAGTVVGSGMRPCVPSTDTPPSSRPPQGKPAYKEQCAQVSGGSFNRVGAAEQHRGLEYHLFEDPSDPNVSVWPLGQQQARQNRRQRTCGPGQGPGLRAAPPPDAHDVDGVSMAPTHRPVATSSHRVDGTTQTEVPAAQHPGWPSTPSPPPPLHPPPVLFPSEDSSPKAEGPYKTNETQTGDPQHGETLPGEEQQRWTHSVSHQHKDVHTRQHEHQDVHHDSPQYQEVRPGDHGQVSRSDVRHQDVQCSGESGQTYPGDQEQSVSVELQYGKGYSSDQEHTDVQFGDVKCRETRPSEPRSCDPRHECARPQPHPDARERPEAQPGGSQTPQGGRKIKQSNHGNPGELRSHDADASCEARDN